MNATTKKPKIGAAQIKLLERLSNACAVSGDEGAVRKIVLEEIKVMLTRSAPMRLAMYWQSNAAKAATGPK